MRFAPFGFYGKPVLIVTAVTPAPADTTLGIWFDASGSVFNPNNSNGTAITQWSDKAGTAHNAAPIGNGPTQRPVVTTNFQNGNTVLYFTGSQGLVSNVSTILQSLSGSTVFIVGRTIITGSLAQEQHFIEGAQVQGSSYTPLNAYSLIMSGSYGYNLFFAGGQAKSGTSTTLDTKFHYHTLVYNGNGATNADKLIYRIDGTNQTLTFVTNIGSTTSATVNAFAIGAQGDNTATLYGYIGEIIVYTRLLTTSEILNTEAYLKNKWNL